GRSRPSRAADSTRLRRKKFADRHARTDSSAAAGNRQRTGCCLLGKGMKTRTAFLRSARAGKGVSASRTFLESSEFRQTHANPIGSLFRRNVETSTLTACAPDISLSQQSTFG